MIFLIFGFIAAVLATFKGRNGLIWFVIGALFPVIGVLLSAVVPRVR